MKALTLGLHSKAIDFDINLSVKNISLKHRIDALIHEGNFERAKKECNRAIKALEHPEDKAEVVYLMGKIKYYLEQPAGALKLFSNACKLWPDYWLAWAAQGEIYSQFNKDFKAIQCFHECTRINPGNLEGWRLLGESYMKNLEFEKSTACYMQVIKTNPQSHLLWHLMSVALHAQGRHDLSVKAGERCLELMYKQQETGALPEKNSGRDPQLIHGAHLFTLTGVEKNFDKLMTAYKAWAAKYASDKPEKQSFAPGLGERKIRIGFVGADFFRHAALNIYGNLFEAIDKDRFEVQIYSNTDKHRYDAQTKRIKEDADMFLDVAGLTDEELLETIRANQPDILFDLNGHTQGNRLKVFAKGAAPIQVTGLGYVSPLNAPCFDYVITDKWLTDEYREKAFIEKPLYLNGPLMHWSNNMNVEADPSEDYPCNIGKTGVTFGSTNNLYKIGPQVIGVWSQILKKLPGARLLFKSKQLECKFTVDRIIEQFKNFGVYPDQLSFVGLTSHKMHMNTVHQIDILLDPFPYQGGITTAEALHNGCPVITLNEGTRTACSVLGGSGFKEWIADDLRDYTEKAVALAKSIKKATAPTRKEISDQFSGSLIRNKEAFAADFENAVVKALLDHPDCDNINFTLKY